MWKRPKTATGSSRWRGERDKARCADCLRRRYFETEEDREQKKSAPRAWQGAFSCYGHRRLRLYRPVKLAH